MRGYFNKPVTTIYSLPRETKNDGGLIGAVSDEGLYGMEADMEKLGGRHTGWARVRAYYGYEGYARLDDLTAADAFFGTPRLFIVSRFADILSAPSIDSRLIVHLPRGAVVHDISSFADVPDGWSRVGLLDGRSGYARSRWLAPFAAELPELPEEELRGRICASAISYIGSPYRWGGKTPGGIDCSGLCSMAYLLNGIKIYRDARLEEGYPVRRIDINGVKAADLLYFEGHVAMYLGGGLFIHSTCGEYGDGVVVNAFDASRASRYPYPERLLTKITAAGSVFP